MARTRSTLIFHAGIATALATAASMNAVALDATPTTPSTQISETLPTPRPIAPGTTGLDKPFTAQPDRAFPGYNYVAPLGRQRGDRTGSRNPWSHTDSDSDGVPNSRDHRPFDADRQ